MAGSNGRRFRFNALYWLTWFHRWVGVALCLIFAMWFASGEVMVFVPFPSLAESARLAKSEAIDFSRLNMAPATALNAAPQAEELRLSGIVGRPVYLASSEGRPTVAIGGDDGVKLALISGEVAQHIAERFLNAKAAGVEGPFDYDQWVVYQGFDSVRPFYRIAIDDADGSELYVSARTGEVLQQTRRTERMWNWAGSVIHWVYFTPLRKSFYAWNEVVWWLSFVGVLMTAAGIWIGSVAFLKLRRTGRSGLSPFRGWLGWHHAIGLVACIFVLTWIFSGWLSMDHGFLFSTAQPSNAEPRHFMTMPVADVAEAVSLEDIKSLQPASEVRFSAIGQASFVVARGGSDPQPRIFWASSMRSAPMRTLPGNVLWAAVQTAWPKDAILSKGPASINDIYSLAEGVPDNTLLFVAARANPVGIYIDNVTGKLLATTDGSRRTYAWLYYALHTFNFPGLSQRTLLHHAIVSALMALGFAFSITGVVVGVNRLRRIR